MSISTRGNIDWAESINITANEPPLNTYMRKRLELEKGKKTVETLVDWTYKRVMDIALSISSQYYEDDSTNPQHLEQFHRKLEIETGDLLVSVSRDFNELKALIPSVEQIKSAIDPVVKQQLKDKLNFSVDNFLDNMESSDHFIKGSLGDLSVDWLAQKSNVSQAIYKIGREIQKLDPSAAHEFSINLMKINSNDITPELQEKIETLELRLGEFWLDQLYYYSQVYEFDFQEVVELGFKKYGKIDEEGHPVCGWCQNTFCTCGSRHGGINRDSEKFSQVDASTQTIPDMDERMWINYGFRNGAIGGKEGAVRALGERAELIFALELKKAGGLKNLGKMYSHDSHYVEEHKKDVDKAISKYKENHPDKEITDKLYEKIEMQVIEISIKKELADVLVSWPTLLAQNFGVNHTSGIKRALKKRIQDIESA